MYGKSRNKAAPEVFLTQTKRQQVRHAEAVSAGTLLSGLRRVTTRDVRNQGSHVGAATALHIQGKARQLDVFVTAASAIVALAAAAAASSPGTEAPSVSLLLLNCAGKACGEMGGVSSRTPAARAALQMTGESCRTSDHPGDSALAADANADAVVAVESL